MKISVTLKSLANTIDALAPLGDTLFRFFIFIATTDVCMKMNPPLTNNGFGRFMVALFALCFMMKPLLDILRRPKC